MAVAVGSDSATLCGGAYGPSGFNGLGKIMMSCTSSGSTKFDDGMTEASGECALDCSEVTAD